MQKEKFDIKTIDIKILCILLFFISFSSLSKSSTKHQFINNLTVEYSPTPLGIDVHNPRFGWQMEAFENERGVKQTSYQIQVTSTSGDIVWNSGKVNDSKAISIRYNGTPLKPQTKYFWTVTVWDQKNHEHSANSWFETGLMNSNQSAWNGAQWIGGSDEDLVFFSDYQSIFKLKYILAIKEGSSKAAFVYGANDIRLMDKYKNVFQLENKLNESYIKLELDISEVNPSINGFAKLNIYRSGYTKDDSPHIPLKTFVISPSLINAENKHSKHNFEIQSAFGLINISINGKREAFATLETEDQNESSYSEGKSATINLNPLGQGGDYLSFGMVCDIGFAMEVNQKAKFSDVEVFNDRFPNKTLFKENLSRDYDGIFTDLVEILDDAYYVDGSTSGVFVVANPSKNSTPMLRTEFKSSRKAESARLYVTSRGIYEFFINGERVGKDYYNPGQTQYNKTHFYQTYDVTEMIGTGENAMGVMLSEGWWSGLLSFGTIWNHFGDRQSILAQLVITYDDNSTKIITTNDKEWTFYNKGPIIYSSLNLGEVYDATKEKEVEGWTKKGFNDSDWKKAKEIHLEGTSFYRNDKDYDKSKEGLDFNNMKLIGQIGNNAGEFKTLTAKSMKEVRPGVYVYNMGQNIVGVPIISIANGIVGDTLMLRFAEILYPDLPESRENVGMIMTENYRAALSKDIYIMKDGDQVFQPKFTSHGYQYIEITGIDEPLPLEAVQGLAISSVLELTADYKTSNQNVNQLWSNLVWSNIDNFLTIPTDCPQRNERMGWSGDISVFSRTASYISNANQFLRRHMIAMRDVQEESGRFTDIAPIGGGFGGVLWGSAGITVPWEVYHQYNDVGILEEHYDAMMAYINYIETIINPKSGIITDGELGDWLGPQNNTLGTPYLTTAYHVYDLHIMKEVANLLGKTQDAARFEELYKKRKDFFNKTFINEAGKTIGMIGNGRSSGALGETEPDFKLADTQTSYAVGLALDLFNDDLQKQMAKNLAETIERENIDDNGIKRPKYSLMTGFIGTAWVSKALSDYGYDEQAYKLLQNNQFPSWLYSIEQGATTIWERLNGYTKEDGFGGNNHMNSFNHYTFGAVGQWMLAYSLGIQRAEPGFQRFILQPTPDPTGEMTWAEGHYDSMYGRITSRWEVKNGKLIYEVTVPANTSATLYLPAKSKNAIRDFDNCTLMSYEDGKAIFKLESGKYRFVADL